MPDTSEYLLSMLDNVGDDDALDAIGELSEEAEDASFGLESEEGLSPTADDSRSRVAELLSQYVEKKGGGFPPKKGQAPPFSLNYDPEQPRGDDGKWTKGGGSSDDENPLRRFENSRAIKDLLSGSASHEMFSGNFGGKRDTLLEAILKDHGKDALPLVLRSEQITKLQKEGWTVGYRGVSDEVHAEAFKHGENYCGSGIFGNGTYIQREGGFFGIGGKSQQAAIDEAREYGAHILRIAVPPTAKVATLSQVDDGRRKYEKELGERRWRGEINAEDYDKLMKAVRDKGRMAAILGFDVVKCTWRGYWNLLNRKILAVQDRNLSGREPL
jgi:hypothetical protein